MGMAIVPRVNERSPEKKVLTRRPNNKKKPNNIEGNKEAKLAK